MRSTGAFVAALIFGHGAASSSRPNILYILGDDQGHADIGYHNNGSAGYPSTPNMDRLAGTGVILESFYTQPICAASRSSILTGRYVSRLGFQHFNPPMLGGGAGAIPLKEKLLPEFMKEAGYSTHLVGKWHGGMIKESYLPQHRGFDSAFGYYEGAIDYYKHTAGPTLLDFHEAEAGGEQRCLPNLNGTYDLDLFASRAKSVVRMHDESKPLFMYLALHSVHQPSECPQQWYDKYAGVSDTDNRRTMCGMVSAMDAAIGDIVEAWQKKSMRFWNNTVVLYHSDNGGPTYAGAGTSNVPLRGGKLTLFEGGMRVNAWMHSPLLPSGARGRVELGLMHITDLLPTFATLAGANLSLAPNALDGQNMWPTLMGNAPSPRKEILHLIDPLGNADLVMLKPTSATLGCGGFSMERPPGRCSTSAALRSGAWKLIIGMFARCAQFVHANTERLCGWYSPPNSTQDVLGLRNTSRPSFFIDDNEAIEEYPVPSEAELEESLRSQAVHSDESPLVLFNIDQDPEERHDVARQNPEVVQKLLARIDEFRSAEWHDPQWPPFQACDTPTKSCDKLASEYKGAAARKGCIDVFVPSSAEAFV